MIVAMWKITMTWIGLTLMGGCVMVDKTPTDVQEQMSDLVVVDFAYESEYVIGMPVYVALTVAPRIKGNYALLPLANFLDLGGCIGLHLTRLDRRGKSVRFVPPAPHLDPEEPMGDWFDLAAGERRRMLVDLSPVIPPDLEAGEYRLHVSYVTSMSTARSDVATVMFRAPTDPEQRRLARVASDRGQYRSWAEWIENSAPNAAILAAPVEADDSMRFALVLRNLLHSSTPLAQVDPQVLSPLTGLYEPEGLALQAELFHACRKIQSFAQVKSLIETQHSGLVWWIRGIEEGDGEIQWRRAD